tara:strand:- start:876 stop:1130 length:255 start_codon:yes stop_codon:yes gene_type:complete
MSNLIIIIILIGVYVISFALTYLYMRLAHSRGGVWASQHTTTIEVLIVVMPGLNTVFMIQAYLLNWPVQRWHRFNADKFFKLNK